jgi:2-oxoglutarate dehydrogenase E2 component (dihydrolipoamide succinyltransferase)
MTDLQDVRLPHMGVVERAMLTGWLKKVGDRVEADEPLCEISTDKVDTEVASPQAGVLIEVLAQVNEEIEVGAVIARFAPADASPADIAEVVAAGAATATAGSAVAGSAVVADSEQVPSRPPTPVVPEPSAPESAMSAPAEGTAVSGSISADVLETTLPSLVLRAATPPPVAPPPPGDGRRSRGFSSSPLVRRLAQQAGIDLGTVPGTGLRGRITRADVEKAIAATRENGQAATPPQAPPARADTQRQQDGAQLPPGYQDVPYEAVPLTAQRRATARHMVRSASTAPQLTAQVDVDMSQVARVREQINERRRTHGEGKLSYLPFIARAFCAALADHPDVNATFTDEHLIRWRTVNLGVAVDAPHGLFVPVLRGAERLALGALADALADLAGRVQDRTVTPDDLTAGTITISNSGSVGGVTSMPMLLPPQVASLGVPAIVRTPVAVTAPNGEEYVAIRPVARLGLTFDHRAIDGAEAIRTLNDLRRNLETWPVDAYL